MIIGVVQSLVSYYNWEFKKRYEKKIVSEEQKKNSIPHKKMKKKNRLKKNRLIKKMTNKWGKIDKKRRQSNGETGERGNNH